MKNRPRPTIPLAVRVQVADRQCRRHGISPLSPTSTAAAIPRRLSDRLAFALHSLFGDERPHLDHDPPLRVRAYNPRVKDVAARYTPNANDPNHLIYRTAHEHRIKTNVRGDGAQHPDRVLINRERDRERNKRKPVSTFRSQRLRSANRWPPKGSRKIQSRRKR